MPNHCDADLAITGPMVDVVDFLFKYVTEADGSLLSLDAIRPYPQKFKDLDRIAREWAALPADQRVGTYPKDGFNQGGYEWCCDNWGTKWGCYSSVSGLAPIERTKDGVILHFSTAWGPFRFDLLEEVSEKFPALSFQYDYYEHGMAFQGYVRVAHGRVVEEAQSEYHGNRGG